MKKEDFVSGMPVLSIGYDAIRGDAAGILIEVGGVPHIRWDSDGMSDPVNDEEWGSLVALPSHLCETARDYALRDELYRRAEKRARALEDRRAKRQTVSH